MKPSQRTAVRSYPSAAAFASRRRDGLSPVDGRLRVEVHTPRSPTAGLRHDVRQGLLAPQKTLPPKYFYDDHGAQLFDAICDLPEYYLTRTEQALLDRVADEIVALSQPGDVVELGSGAARKTRIVLDALTRNGRTLTYMPMDVSEGMLRRAARALLRDYPRLRVHAVVADYEGDWTLPPRTQRRLVLFLGSTIGNFTPAATATFLATLRGQLAVGDHFLLGVDLVKPVAVLEAAYNDRQGLTAAFNRNILRVINRELAADFALEGFEHLAFFNRTLSQIEMHLRARQGHEVTLDALGLRVTFTAGETIHTEISRKFTRDEAEDMLAAGGFELVRWYTPANNYFALALAGAR
jgi:L-histidine N-alpha-methyltransferase